MSFPHLSRSLRASGALSSSRNATTFISPRINPSTRLLQYRPLSYTPARQQDGPYQQPNPTTTPPHQSQPSSSSQSSPSTSTSRIPNPTPNHQTTDNISKTGLSDKPLELEINGDEKVDWTRSFHGLSAAPFPKEVADILLGETDPEEVEVKPDGIVYLPEIKYRRILNKAFGPGAWGLVPRSESIVTPKTVTREYALVCNGRYVFFAFLFWFVLVLCWFLFALFYGGLKETEMLMFLFLLDWSPSPAANRTTSPPTASQPLRKDAGLMRSCAAARTWVLPANSGIRGGSASSRPSILARHSSSMS